MRFFTIATTALLIPTFTTVADYEAPETSWHKPLPSFENRRIHLVHQPQQEATSLEKLVDDTKLAFRAMDGLRNVLGKEQMRRDIIDALLKRDDVVELAKKTLIDPEFAKSTYLEDQAIARIYSIELLGRKADLGDFIPLLSTTKDLTTRLNGRIEISKGELRDLEDLIYECLRRVQPGDVKSLVEQFNYAPQLKDTFMDAAAFALRGKISDAEIERLRLEL